MSRSFAFVSGKGGTGKSTAAVLLAAAMGKAGNKVLLVDLACEMRCLDLYLGLENNCMNHIFDVFRKRMSLSEAVAALPHMDFLAACQTRPLSQASPEMWKAFREEAEALYDVILYDLPGGREGECPEGAELFDFILYVTTPEPCAIRGMDQMKNILEKNGPREGAILLNGIRNGENVSLRSSDPEELSELSGLPIAGLWPFHENFTCPALEGSFEIKEERLLSMISLTAKKLLSGEYLSPTEWEAHFRLPKAEENSLQKEKPGFLKRIRGIFSRNN